MNEARTTDPSQLPHLLKLLDDDSPRVQDALVQSLMAFGASLFPALDSLPQPPTPAQRLQVRGMLRGARLPELLPRWSAWVDSGADNLEEGLGILCGLLSGTSAETLSVELEEVVQAFRLSGRENTPRDLSAFLHETWGLTGNREDYAHPDNSDLIQVLQRRQGLPLSLSLIFMLLGQRLSMNIAGCNLPGHFVACVIDDSGPMYVDGFHEFRWLTRQEIVDAFANPEDLPALARALDESCDALTMIARVLNNLLRGYTEQQDAASAELIQELAEELQRIPSARPETPSFRPGTIVRHRRYGYRGVVVDADRTCQAGEAWYKANQTQPDRDQPWYSVLVHGSDQITYAAESNLIAEAGPQPIAHPLVPAFFSRFSGGRYVRNDRLWPKRNRPV